MPAGLSLSLDEINHQLRRRQRGFGRGGRQRIERDQVEILSGVRFGKTLGSPIALLIQNRDWENWRERMDPWQEPSSYESVTVPRPGHADLAGAIKYQHRDLRNVLERASARETAMRVALGAIARQLLSRFGIEIASHVVQIHDAQSSANALEFEDLKELNAQADASPVRCLDPEASERMVERIREAMKKKDSVGGVFELIARGVPPGLGSHVHPDRKLDARIACEMMSIQAMKGVEIGLGFEAARRFGSAVHDPIYYEPKRGFYRSTQGRGAGGIEGGISTGDPILVRVAMKPLSTLPRPLDSVDIVTKEPAKAHVERTDVCAVPAASVVAENVLALVLADAFLEKLGGDSIAEIEERWRHYPRDL
jgi:chorismate synthase